MLKSFLADNRSELIDRCRARVANRRAPRATPAELEHGIPLFLQQLTAMLPAGETPLCEPAYPRQGPAAESRLHETATRHGQELLRHDFSIDQVVHDYGDLCQSITQLASEKAVPIAVEDFGALNIRLDNAIADAVTEYSRQRDIISAGEHTLAIDHRLGVLAREMRNLLNTAIIAISAIKGGGVGFGGATAAALDRSLIGLRGLIDSTLADVRLECEPAPRLETIELASFIAEVRVAAALEACTAGCDLTVRPVEPKIFVQADRHILASAVANLLQNAFGFARSDGHVLLSAHACDGHVLVEVEDVGTLPSEAGMAEAERRGSSAAIALGRQGVEASGGRLYAREVPGRGTVITIDLPQKILVANPRRPE